MYIYILIIVNEHFKLSAYMITLCQTGAASYDEDGMSSHKFAACAIWTTISYLWWLVITQMSASWNHC